MVKAWSFGAFKSPLLTGYLNSIKCSGVQGLTGVVSYEKIYCQILMTLTKYVF
jgi:hypothetical protein